MRPTAKIPAGRQRLLEPNVKVFEEVVPRLIKAAPESVILIATNTPEPLVEITRHFAAHERVPQHQHLS